MNGEQESREPGGASIAFLYLFIHKIYLGIPGEEIPSTLPRSAVQSIQSTPISKPSSEVAKTEAIKLLSHKPQEFKKKKKNPVQTIGDKVTTDR